MGREDELSTDEASGETTPTTTVRALAIWLLLIAVEILYGIARGIFLVPHLGDFRSRQIGVGTGSLIILAVALAFVRWIGTSRPSHLLGIGLLWAMLTLAFEILFGRFVVGAPWKRLLSDYNVVEGGLMPFGIAVPVLSPLIARKVRGVA